MSHTPEPWSVEGHQIVAPGRRAKLLIAQVHETAMLKDESDHADADAERIVACVNACKGIANPAAVRNLLEACKEAMEETAEHPNRPLGRATLAIVRGALAKAEGK